MKRIHADELMDAEELDEATYVAVVRDLARANTVTLARRPTLRFVKKAVGERASFSLLDVGFGDGDMLRTIAAWATRAGKTAKLVGIDLNPRSLAAARAHGDHGIDYRIGDYQALGDEPWDLIVSSLVAHHMSHDELVAFLRFMEAHAQAGWFVNDLHRHPLPYHGFPLLARVAGWHPIVRHDGQVSVGRSFVAADWHALLAEAGVEDARIERVFPFRLCVARRR